MKPLRSGILTLLTCLTMLLYAHACAFEDEPVEFVGGGYADGTFADFAKGKLGIIQPGWHSRYLVLAYRQLLGETLTPDEQQQAVTAHNFAFSHEDDWYGPVHSSAGLDAWVAARASIGPVDGYVPPQTLASMRPTPGSEYEYFPNCLSAAFQTAAATLQDRAKRYGAKSPEVLEWVRGQDAVFSNCGDGKPQRYFGPPEKGPAPPPAPHPPATLTSAPKWLQQDRAYQLAAAKFYAMDFDGALAGFQAIAADTASPWSTTARYMEARVALRQASLIATFGATAELTRKNEATRQAALVRAAQQLTAMQHEPRMQPMRHAIDSLLDVVNARLHPAEQQIVVAERLLAPHPADLTQNLIDSTALQTPSGDIEGLTLQPKPGETATPRSAAANDPRTRNAVDMLDWIDAMNNGDAAAANKHWRATHSVPWLIAAMAFANPGDADAPALIAEARKLPRTNPAWLTVTYHRLRLESSAPATRVELLTLLPEVHRGEGRSAINAFSTLLAGTSPDLHAWLELAARYAPQAQYLPAPDSSDGTSTQGATPLENVCGGKQAELPSFDYSYVYNLNNHFPLDELARAAEDTTLPADLHYQIAEATWARAVLLDRPQIAHRMTPLLVACRAAWKPVLEAYDSSRADDDRHANGLLALMRFSTTEPSVRLSRNTFAVYSEMRDNWWCTAVPTETQTVETDWRWNGGGDGDATSHGPRPPAPSITTPPAFLTASQLSAAQAEVTNLRRIPRASSYFAHEALAWQTTHPKDPRTADIVGEAFRVVRNGCRFDPVNGPDANTQRQRADQIAKAKARGDEPTADLAHKLFDVLHRDYPNSEWTKRYKTWE